MSFHSINPDYQLHMMIDDNRKVYVYQYWPVSNHFLADSTATCAVSKRLKKAAKLVRDTYLDAPNDQRAIVGQHSLTMFWP